MSKQLFIVILLLGQLVTFGQKLRRHPDSVIVIFKNASQKDFIEYRAVINGQTISGRNLQTGDSIHFKIAIKGTNVYRFTIYTDKDLQQKYSIEPIDYFDQVSKLKIKSGEYQYFININEKGGYLDIKLKKNKYFY